MVRRPTTVKDEAFRPPVGPTRAVRDRVTDLGYGSGPWERPDLIAKWGEAVTGKTIQEAKEFGWLVSPYQGQYFVPSARDLMVAAWLPPAERVELVASRTFAKTGIRYWCLSAWARTRGLLFSEPLFVTDLASTDADFLEPRADLSLVDLSEDVRARAKKLRRVPFAANTILVPALGRLSAQRAPARVDLPARARKLQRREGQPDALVLAEDEPAPWVIEYAVSRDMEDTAWLLAFLNALRLPRIQEGVEKLLKRERADRSKGSGSQMRQLVDGATWWASFFAPPSPNENWNAILATGRAQYLLVPPSLWEETIDLTTSRAYDDLSRLRRQVDA